MDNLADNYLQGFLMGLIRPTTKYRRKDLFSAG